MLFNKQNEKRIDPRYFLKETILKESPSSAEVMKLAAALSKIFGDNVEMGQSSNGAVFKGNGRMILIKAVSGVHRKLDIQTPLYKAGTKGAENSAYVLLQNAELMEKVMMPIIKKIYHLAGETMDKKEGDSEEIFLPPSMDEREQFAKLKQENEELKAEIEKLKEKLYGKKNPRQHKDQGLEIDE